ncbi:MAG: SAM-dependent methyltransferase [Promethearchaeota archaeon]
MGLEVPIIIGIVLIILFISIFWPGIVGAPWVPTSMGMVHKMLKLADVGPDDVVYDLGCGDGRTIVTAARHYGARAVGIEIDPLRYLWCQILITVLRLRSHIKILYGNFFYKDLSEATLVTCYLLQDTNDKLEKKLLKELHPGTKVVSNYFTFSGLQMVREDGEARFYLVPSTSEIPFTGLS